MNEIVFVIDKTVDGGCTAYALGESIFIEGDDIESLKTNARDAVECHFEPSERPEFISFEILNPLTKEQKDGT